MKDSIFNFSNCVEYLSYLLINRIKGNKFYSLRAFARDLNLSPSLICQILSQKKYLSCKQAYSIAHRLKLNAEETFYLLDLTIIINPPDKQTKKEAITRINNKRKYHQKVQNSLTYEETLVRDGVFKSVKDIPGYWYCD